MVCCPNEAGIRTGLGRKHEVLSERGGYSDRTEGKTGCVVRKSPVFGHDSRKSKAPSPKEHLIRTGAGKRKAPSPNHLMHLSFSKKAEA